MSVIIHSANRPVRVPYSGTATATDLIGYPVILSNGYATSPSSAITEAQTVGIVVDAESGGTYMTEDGSGGDVYLSVLFGDAVLEIPTDAFGGTVDAGHYLAWDDGNNNWITTTGSGDIALGTVIGSGSSGYYLVYFAGRGIAIP